MQARGPLLAQPVSGQADVDFGLRYEKSDHTLRATDLRLRPGAITVVPDGLRVELLSALP